MESLLLQRSIQNGLLDRVEMISGGCADYNIIATTLLQRSVSKPVVKETNKLNRDPRDRPRRCQMKCFIPLHCRTKGTTKFPIRWHPGEQVATKLPLKQKNNWGYLWYTHSFD